MNQKQAKKTFTLQQGQSDCGVACLLSVIRYHGGEATLENLRESSGTTKQGTSLLGLYQAALKYGFAAQGYMADMTALKSHAEPLILHVLIDEKLEHYVVCYGYENGKFVIGDPGHSVQTYTEDELNNIWVSKKCLTLLPNEHFVKREQNQKARKEWLVRLAKDDIQLLAVSAALGLLIAILGMSLSVFSQKLIDNILPSKEMPKLVAGIVFLFVLLLFRSGILAMRQFLLLRQSKDFNNRIVGAFYGSLLSLPKPFFDTRKIGEMVARLNDTARIQRVISQIAGNAIIDMLVAVVALAFLYTYSTISGIIATILLPVYFVLIYSFNKRIIDAQKQVMVGYAQSESNYINTIQGITVIKNTNRQTFFSKLNRNIYGNFQEKVFSLGKINIKLGLLSGIVGTMFLIAILLVVSLQVFRNLMKPGELMAIVGISSTLLPAVGNLALIAIPLNEARIAFERMFEFVNIKPENSKGKEIGTISTLSAQKLSFRFAGRKHLFSDVSFTVNKGETIAIVGESGCGKSTLVQLLQKSYFPESGELVVNGHTNLDELSTNMWRKKVGVVQQDVHLFNGTVLENISLSEKVNTDDVINFCDQLGMLSLINKFPQGIYTLVGEEGVNLSGGQKQLVAFARALYRKPEVLLIDEGTSAMDAETEKRTLDMLRKIKGEIITLFVTHRLHVLKNFADRIYVMENGNAHTNGSHNKLMDAPNFYSNFWKSITV